MEGGEGGHLGARAFGWWCMRGPPCVRGALGHLSLLLRHLSLLLLLLLLSFFGRLMFANQVVDGAHDIIDLIA